MNLPWIEKYRPDTLDDVIDHSEKISTLRNLIDKQELTHLLFYGLPGSGKTSLILACAREMYGDQYLRYILELNASDERGIDTIRNKIPDFVKTSSNYIKLVILDEADALTSDAQSALRRVIEKYSKSSRFCLICNNINKIIPGLQSRCTKMRFGHLNAGAIKDKLNLIIEKEKVKITDEAIDRLINLNKDFRQILNTLQCLHSIKTEDQPIQAEEINNYLGVPTQKQLNQIMDVLSEQDFQEACNQINDFFRDNQWNLSSLIHYLVEYVVNHPEMPQKQKFYLIKNLSDIEVKLSQSNDGEVQLYGLVAVFKQSFLIH